MRKSKENPLKIGKETYGKKNIEEAFNEALKPYFKEDHRKLKVNKVGYDEEKRNSI